MDVVEVAPAYDRRRSLPGGRDAGHRNALYPAAKKGAVVCFAGWRCAYPALFGLFDSAVRVSYDRAHAVRAADAAIVEHRA